VRVYNRDKASDKASALYILVKINNSLRRITLTNHLEKWRKTLTGDCKS